MVFTVQALPGTTRTLVGSTIADYDIPLSAIDRPRVISGEAAEKIFVDDIVYDRYSSAEVAYEFDAIVDVPPGGTLESLDTDVATIAAHGAVTRVSDGLATIRVRSPRFSRVLHKAVSYSASIADADVYSGLVAESLQKVSRDAVNTRLVGKSPSTDKIIHDGTTYNATRWCDDIDLTCLSREIPRVTAVTRRHVIMARHYQNAGPVSFLQLDGTIVTRNVLRRKNMTGSQDIAIGLLAGPDLPVGITPTKVLPENWAMRMPSVNVSSQPGPLLLCLDQEEKALTKKWRSAGSSGAMYASVATPDASDADAVTFSETIVSGDSGNPSFLLVPVGGMTHPALVLTWHFATSGPNYGTQHDEVNALIAAIDSDEGIDTGYTLDTIDLSGYPSYA